MLTIAGRDDCSMTILSARPTSPASVDAGLVSQALVSQALVSQAVVSQAPAAVLMVRPHHFRPNVEECPDNHFMSLPTLTPTEHARRAFDEVTAMAEGLRALGVEVDLVDDIGTVTPDSVFPNNWFTTHADGTVVTYPMMAPSRRLERRVDVLDLLHDRYAVRRVLDLSEAERTGRHLEGTGVLVLDHVHRVAYVGRSDRTDETVLQRFSEEFGYAVVLFDTADRTGSPIYHTNVLMNVGTDLALVGTPVIAPADRPRVLDSLRDTGHEVVELTMEQLEDFAGNALEVQGSQSRHLVMSARGVGSLTAAQRATIERRVPLHAVDIPTIEHAGGSARCMLAGIHLPRR